MAPSILLLLVLVLVTECSVQRNMRAALGNNVVLPCRAVGSGSVIAIEWTKHGLEPYFVLLYRDSQFDQEQQHSSYKNRVDLQDREMRDGNVSLVLRNVNTADKGRYECRVFLSKAQTLLDDSPTSIIQLDVSPKSKSFNTRNIGNRENSGNRGNRGNRAGPVELMVVLTLLMMRL